MICIYISAFLITQSTPTNPETLIPKTWNQNEVIFYFFWSGFYQQMDLTDGEVIDLSGSSYFAPYWPFFVLLLLLIQEKICQMWLTDKYGTNTEMMEAFEKIEKRYQEIQEERKEKKKKLKEEAELEKISEENESKSSSSSNGEEFDKLLLSA